jgi:hypothetical protein
VLGLDAYVATVDVTIQSMDSQLQAETRHASEIEESVANPIAGTDEQEDRAAEGADAVFEAEEEALAPVDPGALHAMRLGAHPATAVVYAARPFLWCLPTLRHRCFPFSTRASRSPGGRSRASSS